MINENISWANELRYLQYRKMQYYECNITIINTHTKYVFILFLVKVHVLPVARKSTQMYLSEVHVLLSVCNFRVFLIVFIVAVLVSLFYFNCFFYLFYLSHSYSI